MKFIKSFILNENNAKVIVRDSSQCLNNYYTIKKPIKIVSIVQFFFAKENLACTNEIDNKYYFNYNIINVLYHAYKLELH